MAEERIYTVPLTAFDTLSAGAELSVAAGGITVNPVNKIAIASRSESRLTPVGDELWYVRYTTTGIVQKLNQADLSDAGTITLQWTGANTVYHIWSFCVIGNFIYGLVRYRAALDLKAVGKWDLTGVLVSEFINYVNPPADGELWSSVYGMDMATDGTHLYIIQNQVVGGQYYIKKFDLTGAFVAKCAVTPIIPNGICLGQDGFLYITDSQARRTVKINPTTMVLVTLVDSHVTDYYTAYGHINAIDDDHIYKCLGWECAVSIQSTDANHDYRGAFGAHPFNNLGEYTVATGRPAGTFRNILLTGLGGYFLYIHDLGTALFETVIHKIYVREDRTMHTATAPITGEADLKAKMDFVTIAGYKRLDIREDADGGRITYYRSEDGIAWVEVTRASRFDLSAHPVTSPLYLKAHVDNLAAKVGAPTVYGIDVVAEGDPPDYAALLAVYNALLAVYNALVLAHAAVTAIEGTVTAGDTIHATIEADTIEAVLEE